MWRLLPVLLLVSRAAHVPDDSVFDAGSLDAGGGELAAMKGAFGASNSVRVVIRCDGAC